MMIDNTWAAFLPPFALGAVFAAVMAKAYSTRQLDQRVAQMEELALCRHWVRSLRKAWRLLPSLTTHPVLHHRATTVIATCLDRLKAYDAGIVAYDNLIERLANQDPVSALLRAQRAIAQLVNGQLTDADVALRRLRGHGHGQVAATCRLASLVQQAQTNHWADAVEQSSSELVNQLRPLGVEAGYGYALMALACYKLTSNQPSAEPDRAEMWWSYATRLLPVGALVDRFSEVGAAANVLASESAVPPPVVWQT